MKTGMLGMRPIVLALAVALSAANVVQAQECMTEVSGAMDKQREAYIAAQASLADQNYSRRPGSFASTTCLDNLMKGGGLDIFFKPPNLDTIIGMIKNLACEQASQIFEQLVGGSGVNGGGILAPGEIMSGVNLGGSGVRLPSIGSGSSIRSSGSIMDLYK